MSPPTIHRSWSQPRLAIFSCSHRAPPSWRSSTSRVSQVKRRGPRICWAKLRVSCGRLGSSTRTIALPRSWFRLFPSVRSRSRRAERSVESRTGFENPPMCILMTAAPNTRFVECWTPSIAPDVSTRDVLRINVPLFLSIIRGEVSPWWPAPPRIPAIPAGTALPSPPGTHASSSSVTGCAPSPLTELRGVGLGPEPLEPPGPMRFCEELGRSRGIPTPRPLRAIFADTPARNPTLRRELLRRAE
mmetsp:Transcript_40870/g.130555  ORF Transcript_40870/g.130555 Transcript_40870/m.130555 type:complete len:245 (+) Transcript_40870:729-1463(+)